MSVIIGAFDYKRMYYYFILLLLKCNFNYSILKKITIVNIGIVKLEVFPPACFVGLLITTHSWLSISNVILYIQLSPLRHTTRKLCVTSPLKVKLVNQSQYRGRLEWFSFECRKSKTKAITIASHYKRKQHSEPMINQSKYT